MVQIEFVIVEYIVLILIISGAFSRILEVLVLVLTGDIDQIHNSLQRLRQRLTAQPKKRLILP
jgi:hypothetical protein